MTGPRILAVIVLLGGTTALTISPEYASLGSKNNSLTVRCVADSPITRCQFKVSKSPPVDLSRGHLSNVTGYRYDGEGLEAGHCGATIEKSLLSRFKAHTVNCRMRDDRGDWRYAAMIVTNGEVNIPRTTNARQVLVSPGGDVDLVFETEDPVTYCKLGKDVRWFDTASLQTCATTAISFCKFRKGPEQKQCGITIRNITERLNTRILFHAETRLGELYDFIQVIVIKPPNTPVLTVNTDINPDGSGTVRAVCNVNGSRPAANITWMLGGEVVTAGRVVVLTKDSWVDPWEEQTTTQQLTLTLGATALSQELWCTAHHVALLEPLNSNTSRPLLFAISSSTASKDEVHQQLENITDLHRARLAVEAANALTFQETLQTTRASEEATVKEHHQRLAIEAVNALIVNETLQTARASKEAAMKEHHQRLENMAELHGARLAIEAVNALIVNETLQTARASNEATMKEHQQRLENMAELHRARMQVEAANLLVANARARVEGDTAKPAEASVRMNEANAKQAVPKRIVEIEVIIDINRDIKNP